MVDINIAEAKAHLSELVERAAAGEIVRITKRGKPMAMLGPAEKPRKKIDFEALRAFTATLPREEEDTREFIRKMRDGYRY